MAEGAWKGVDSTQEREVWRDEGAWDVEEMKV